MNTYALSHLTDPALQHGLVEHVAADRAATASLLAYLAEFDARQLYLPAAQPSMHSYCVRVLRMSEDAAYRRITAARTAREFPAIFPMVADGRLHLTAILKLGPHLAPGNADELLAAAVHQSREQIERLLAERFPKADLPDQVAALPTGRTTEPAGELAPERVGASGVADQPAPPAKVAALAPQRCGLQATIGQNTYEKLQYAKTLLGHRVPSGDLAAVLDRALDALVEQLERRKFAACRRPRKGQAPPSANPRHIPAAVERAVCERDQGRCTFVGENGQRCPAEAHLQYDHIVPVARGGESSVDNLRLLCRAHNQFAAERTFGADFMNGRREAAQHAREARVRGPVRGEPAADRPIPKPETNAAASSEAHEDAIAGLRTLGYGTRDAREAIERCGLPPDATVEQLVRAALAYRVRHLLAQSARTATATA